MNIKIMTTATLLALGLSSSMVANAAPTGDLTLQGTITKSTCNIVVNGGKSVLNAGVFKSESFTDVVNKKVGSVDMSVALNGCAAGEDGKLVIQGLTSVKNNDQNIFVDNDANTVGFMISQSNGTTIVKNGEGVAIKLADEATAAEYTFKVGMASTTVAPQGGTYSAPILVAYIVN